MDENLDVNGGEIVLPEEPSTLKQTTEEVTEPVEQEASGTQNTETETAESNKGANQRIRELNAQKKAAEAKAEAAEEKVKSLTDRMAEITQPIGFDTQVPTVPTDTTEWDTETNKFREQVLKEADSRAELKIRQAETVNRINNESNTVLQKYPQLDPKSDDFDKELSDSVTEATEAMIRANPYSASVTKFVDRLMKPYLGSVAKEVGKASENIAKQVTDSALRPTSVRQPEKPASEKTMAELEQELGIVVT